jgi:hypothetical protein
MADFFYGLARTDNRATAATVAYFRENERWPTHANDGMIFAKTAAFAAIVAKSAVYARNRDGDNMRGAQGSLEKKVVIGFLDVAIEKFYRIAD